MTFKALKQTLEDRLKVLDHACDSEQPGTPTFDEVCSRHGECKVILDLVNRVTSIE